MTRPKARPIEIHTADSMAASLMEMTWAVLWTSRRSMISIAVMAPMRATHAQTGVWKLAKFSLPAAVLATRGVRTLVMGSPRSDGGRLPKVSPTRWEAGRSPGR